MAVHARTHTSERVSAALARHALVPRLIVAPPPLASSVQLHARGAISCLAVEPLPAIVEEGDLAADEAKLRVRAISLNFRDVLNVLGEYPRDPGPPIGDCAGKNCRDRRPGHALRVRVGRRARPRLRATRIGGASKRAAVGSQGTLPIV